MTDMMPKKLPTPSDFFLCPIWRYDDEDDLYHPVQDAEELPESERDLSIRAIFTTPSGKKIDGYIVGISRVFSMGLFGEDRFFHANKNLIPETKEWMNEFITQRSDPELRSLKDLFPLHYTTQIDRIGYKDFSGTFDLD